MKCLILAAGYATRLYPLTENFPKPLLKVGDRSILDRLVDDLAEDPDIDEFIVISNHKFADHFKDWAKEKTQELTAAGRMKDAKRPQPDGSVSGGEDARATAPRFTVVDDGTSTNETRLGAVRDILFAMDKINFSENPTDLLVMAGDNVLDFNLLQFAEYAKTCGTSCVMCHEENDLAKQQKTAIITTDDSGLITSYEEKPVKPKGNLAVPPFYYYRAEDAKRVNEALAEGCGADAPGSFGAWLSSKVPMHAYKMPGKRYDIGNLKSYEEAQKIFGNELVSIIIPVFNAAAYIKETIESVEKQTYTNWELLLVDDCGSDDSIEIIEKCRKVSSNADRIRLIRNAKNTGAAESRNHGVEEARGRYIAFLDADDLWLPEKLERQLRFLREKEAGFTFTAYEFGDEAAKGTGKIVHVPQVLDFRHALSRTVIFTSTVMFDTLKIAKERIRMPKIESEDTALWWTILKAGDLAYGDDEVLTIYRRPLRSLSSNKSNAVRRIWNLLIKIAGCSKSEACVHMIGWGFRATMRRL